MDEGLSTRKVDILNPFNDSVLSTVSLANAEQVADTFEVAKEAQKEWAKSTPETRREVMKKAATYLRENRDELIQDHVSRNRRNFA